MEKGKDRFVLGNLLLNRDWTHGTCYDLFYFSRARSLVRHAAVGELFRDNISYYIEEVCARYDMQICTATEMKHIYVIPLRKMLQLVLVATGLSLQREPQLFHHLQSGAKEGIAVY